MSPPTPIAALRKPLASSPAFSTLTAMMIVADWMPPSKKPSMNWMRRTPEKGRHGRRACGASASVDAWAGGVAAAAVPACGPSADPGARASIVDAGVVAAAAAWAPMAASGVASVTASVTASSAGPRRAARLIDGGSVQRIPAMTRNESALRMNGKTSPPVAISSPPIAGPTMKLRLPMLAIALFAGPSWRSSAARLGR